MHIGLFGGTFDPPHRGHQQVSQALLEQQLVDEVWYVPVFQHPWAERLQKKFAPYEHRVAMLELILEPNQKVAHFKHVSFTFDTLEFFSKQYPQHIFTWIMGSEYLPKFKDFLVGHPGLALHPFYIYPRAGAAKQPLYSNMTLLDQVPEVAVSSTQVREHLQAGQPVEDLLDQKVIKYVENNRLYQAKEE